MLKNFKSFYFVGIGGIGMSALARYFSTQKKQVGGYDLTITDLTKNLEKEGITINYKDEIENLPSWINKDRTLIIYTPAIQKTNKQLLFFEKNHFTLKKRAQVLGLLSKEKFVVIIAGTHGKTTISSLLAHILIVGGKKITAFLGGITKNYHSNFLSNGKDIFLLEGDEFDRSFLNFHPDIALISSVDADHLDIYKTAKKFRETFLEFSKKIKIGGKLFVKKGLEFGDSISYGIHKTAIENKEETSKDKIDYYSTKAYKKENKWFFDFSFEKEIWEKLPLPLLGNHNLENTIAAIAIAKELGIGKEKIKKSLESFKGIQRRISIEYISKDKIYIDDYAHHPTELNAIISSVREFFPTKKILGVFQPHLFSRTRDFLEEFASSLSQLDSLILLDIYPARELPIEGVDCEKLLKKITLKEKETSTLSKTLQRIKSKEFEILMTLGAGNINTLVDPIKNYLKSL